MRYDILISEIPSFKTQIYQPLCLVTNQNRAQSVIQR